MTWGKCITSVQQVPYVQTTVIQGSLRLHMTMSSLDLAVVGEACALVRGQCGSWSMDGRRPGYAEPVGLLLQSPVKRPQFHVRCD